MKISIIGANGFIGRNLVSTLASSGATVQSVSSADGSGIDPATGLLPESFAFAAGTQAAMYLAQSPHFRSMPDRASHLLAVNCLSVVRAAVAARAAGVKRFVYVSTGTVYAPSFEALPEDAKLNRDNWYALSKIQGEECIRLFRDDFEVVVCRPFAIYGEHQEARLIPNLIRSVQQQQPISLQPAQLGAADGGLRLSLCHVDDAASALANMALSGGVDLVNLAGEEHFSLQEVAQIIGRNLNIEPVFTHSESLRAGDLVSDPRVFKGFYASPMISFESGIKRVIATAG